MLKIKRMNELKKKKSRLQFSEKHVRNRIADAGRTSSTFTILTDSQLRYLELNKSSYNDVLPGTDEVSRENLF